MVSITQKKTLHSILASKLSKLTIPQISSCSTSQPIEDFNFNDVFGPQSSSSPVFKDPEIIHHRSHSFIGPSPRLVISNPLPFDLFDNEADSQNDGEEDDGCNEIDKTKGEETGKEVCKIGPADFEILRVVGQGSFGKVFQVRKKGDSGIGGVGGDGILAMKVMRKDTILKKNHVDYMKAERDILTKVEHPFIVQLRYSFQTKSKLYLILDFINGGHLFYHLHKQGMFRQCLRILDCRRNLMNQADLILGLGV